MNSDKLDLLWAHLHSLAVLGEHGSFTAAAARLSISKAAMSQRITELERAAGVPLVQRTTRSVRLTEAGQRLVDGTRGAFDQIQQSFATVRDLAAAPHGLLRVTAPVAFARQQLVPRLPEFLRAHPQVRLELDLSDGLRTLAMEGFDLAVRHTAAPPETHVAWLLATTRSVLVASRAYLRRKGQPAEPGDLRAHDCLHYPRPSDTPGWTLRLGDARVVVPVTGPFAANNSEALRDAALAGLGIALVPDFSAQAALRAGQLQQVLPQWAVEGTFSENLYAIRPYSAYVPRAVEAFVAHLRTVFAHGFGV
ncbi:LysR family transcriptional regulator [Pseudorhodoferax sp.]|uniref:LysR family transcriptional regulator n=1 Tax=Pseudorhodoferax sp. TaxID=1993553 RepID=UPI002DD66CBD|nr:LysR family transcriptional regulator [Pseudorhodoferax sp.]